MADRLSRLKELENAAKEYIKAERKRVENEVKSLQDILDGRTGGAGIQAISVNIVAAVAKKDLEEYLKGK
jgi:hypothetical protein